MTLLKPLDNPYHEAFDKSYFFDTTKIRKLCFDGLNIILSSSSILAFYDEDWIYPNLVEIYQNNSEYHLSEILLQLAVSFRTLDDILNDDLEFQQIKEELDKEEFLTCYDGKLKVRTFRECCNKLIHAGDVRPVYANDGEGFYMSSSIELTGQYQKEIWQVSFDVIRLFDAMALICTFVDDRLIR